MMQIRRQMMGVIASRSDGGLPAEYQQVEYLESSGTQYIDTGKIYNENDEITIEVVPLEANVDKAFCGAYDTTITAVMEFGFRLGKLRFDVNQEVFTYSIGQKYKVTKRGLSWYVDDTYICDTNRNKTNTISYFLFGRHYKETVSDFKLSNVKIYSLKHVRGTETILNLIPCVRKADSKPGMYDTVSETFYTNAGTGEFIIPT